MTAEQIRIIDAAVDEAREALPNGTNVERMKLAMRNPALNTPDMIQAFTDEAVKGLIRERASKLGVTLQD